MLFGVDSNLDLAQALFDLGGVQFGEFDLGPTAGMSPIYINPRVLISEPAMLRRIARMIHTEIQADRTRRRPRLSSFRAVAGVPMGGLHIATAYALESDTPLIYLRPSPTHAGAADAIIEGRVILGQSALVIDDLMTGGRSIMSTAEQLDLAGMTVRDAIVLIDREQGGTERLHELGCRVTPILRLRTMLNYYHSNDLIDEAMFERCVAYLRRDSLPAPRDAVLDERPNEP
ncbi:MAG TPA: phosphoribosyltransferase [Thermomicrobiales bacterium]|nr:phosphoribosyltransferase [Thermomicrobiales bacterium]